MLRGAKTAINVQIFVDDGFHKIRDLSKGKRNNINISTISCRSLTLCCYQLRPPYVHSLSRPSFPLCPFPLALLNTSSSNSSCTTSVLFKISTACPRTVENFPRRSTTAHLQTTNQEQSTPKDAKLRKTKSLGSRARTVPAENARPIVFLQIKTSTALLHHGQCYPHHTARIEHSQVAAENKRIYISYEKSVIARYYSYPRAKRR